jgi:hypothetical protein
MEREGNFEFRAYTLNKGKANSSRIKGLDGRDQNLSKFMLKPKDQRPCF